MKKILATGNGRCNFSNVNVEPTKYNNPMFVTPFIKNVDSLNLWSKEFFISITKKLN